MEIDQRESADKPLLSATAALGDIEDFRVCCADHAFFLDIGILALHVAADNLQWLAERWDLIEQHGQDEIQAVMAFAFEPERCQPPSDYAAQIVRRWEMDDPRDAWLHIGELPPPGTVRNGAIGAGVQDRAPRRRDVPQSTIDAFNFVAALGDAEHLARWLRDHADVAAVLLEQLREAA